MRRYKTTKSEASYSFTRRYTRNSSPSPRTSSSPIAATNSGRTCGRERVIRLHPMLAASPPLLSWRARGFCNARRSLPAPGSEGPFFAHVMLSVTNTIIRGYWGWALFIYNMLPRKYSACSHLKKKKKPMERKGTGICQFLDIRCQ